MGINAIGTLLFIAGIQVVNALIAPPCDATITRPEMSDVQNLVQVSCVIVSIQRGINTDVIQLTFCIVVRIFRHF
jgi:hypothetical protein